MARRRCHSRDQQGLQRGEGGVHDGTNGLQVARVIQAMGEQTTVGYPSGIIVTFRGGGIHDALYEVLTIQRLNHLR